MAFIHEVYTQDYVDQIFKQGEERFLMNFLEHLKYFLVQKPIVKIQQRNKIIDIYA